MRFYDSKLSWLARRVSLLATVREGVTASNVVTERVLCCHGELIHLGGELPQFQFFCFAFCVLFTHFCFELVFDINMEVLNKFISFLMSLV